MSKFNSTCVFFVLALLVFSFSGCGGGGGSSNDSPSNSYSWDTDNPYYDNPATTEPTPEVEPNTPSTPVPVTPEPTTPTPQEPTTEPTTPTTSEPDTAEDLTTTPTTPESTTPSTPTPEPTTTYTEHDTPATTTPDTSDNTYTDTYDIASVLNGDWYGVSGSGTATSTNQTIYATLNNMSMNIVRTQVVGDSGTTYITYRQYWDCGEDEYYYYRFRMQVDAELATMTHIGSDTWQLDIPTALMTIILTSESTAIVTQTGRTRANNIENSDIYDYSTRYTIRKSSY